MHMYTSRRNTGMKTTQVEMVGGERESISACETKRGAEGEGGGTCVCVCVCLA